VGERTTCAACEAWFDGADRLYQCRTCPECGVVTRCVVVPPPEVYFAWLLRVTLAAAVGALAGAAVAQLAGG